MPNLTSVTLTAGVPTAGTGTVSTLDNVITGTTPALNTTLSIRANKGSQVTTITSSTAETTVITASATNVLDVYGCIIENTSATATEITFKDATAGTTRFKIFVPAGDTRGFTLSETGAIAQTASNNNWTATCTTSVASVVITMLYVKN